MTRVFIGGSRRVVRLDEAVRARLDRIVEGHLPVVIGDANGADKAVQRYLHERGFEHVEVFCSDESPRNNLGGWPVRVIRPAHGRRDFGYYATKDRAMAAEATVGLMLWDGESRGTLLNVVRLADRDKPVVVYVVRKKRFIDVRGRQQLPTLLAELDRSAVKRLVAVAAAEGLAQALAEQPALAF